MIIFISINLILVSNLFYLVCSFIIIRFSITIIVFLVIVFIHPFIIIFLIVFGIFLIPNLSHSLVFSSLLNIIHSSCVIFLIYHNLIYFSLTNCWLQYTFHGIMLPFYHLTIDSFYTFIIILLIFVN